MQRSKKMSMVKCAWCGKYFNNEVGISGLVGLGSSYCSKACKVAKQNSKGGGSSGGGGGNSGGGGGNSGGDKIRAQAEAYAITQAAVRAAEKADIGEINGIMFSDDPKEIANQMLQLINCAPPFFNCISPGKGKIINAVMDKGELGIRTLRSQGDSVNADYYEKKLKSIKIRKFASLIVMGGFVAVCVIMILFGVM
jgi:hypothetical protein